MTEASLKTELEMQLYMAKYERSAAFEDISRGAANVAEAMSRLAKDPTAIFVDVSSFLRRIEDARATVKTSEARIAMVLNLAATQEIELFDRFEVAKAAKEAAEAKPKREILTQIR